MAEELINNLDDMRSLINTIVMVIKEDGVSYENMYDLYNATANMNLEYPGTYDKSAKGIFQKVKDTCEYMVVTKNNELVRLEKERKSWFDKRYKHKNDPEIQRLADMNCAEINEKMKPLREEIHKWENFKWQIVRHEARQGNFECFILYMEKNRPKEEKFYEGVRDYDRNGKPVLKLVVDAIQDLFDDKLDELFINMPARVGKTQIVKFAFCYAGALYKGERASLYSAFSDKITTAFHTGLMELITDPTYTFWEIFPELRSFSKDGLARSNVKDEIIDLYRSKTYPTYTCRSIDGTLNGSCDCDALAVTDDLLSGYEEAVNANRLETVWGKFDNNFMPRLKKKAKMINMGTRWAILDPQGRRLDLLQNNPKLSYIRWKQIIIPALDKNDKSNFDYNYDKGFTTEMYHGRRASFEKNNDIASWNAQYMQQPTDRDDMLFRPQDLRFFDGNLPSDEPDRVIMAGDVAYGGGDYTSVPVCFQYGKEYFIVDVVYTDAEKNITRPKIVNMAMEYGVGRLRLEATRTTEDYVEKVREMFKERGFRINVESRPPSNKTSKDERILNSAPEIRDFYFLEDGKRKPEYQKFMENLYGFKLGNKNKRKHDDAPDSLAMICDMIHVGEIAKAKVISRKSIGI